MNNMDTPAPVSQAVRELEDRVKRAERRASNMEAQRNVLQRRVNQLQRERGIDPRSVEELLPKIREFLTAPTAVSPDGRSIRLAVAEPISGVDRWTWSSDPQVAAYGAAYRTVEVRLA